MLEVKVDNTQHAVSEPFDTPDVLKLVHVYVARGPNIAEGSVKNVICNPNAEGTIDGDKTFEVKPNPKPIETWRRWGPSYEIELKVTITKFSGRIIYFGSNQLHYGVPLVIAEDNRLIITTQCSCGEKITIQTDVLKTNTLYTVTISHKPSSGDNSKVGRLLQSFIL